MELTLGLQITPEMYLTDPDQQEQHHANKAILKLIELINQHLLAIRTLHELKKNSKSRAIKPT